MSLSIDTLAGPGIVERITAPFRSLREAYIDTERAVARHLLTLDDAALHSLGYRRSDLRRGIVHSVRAD